MAKYTITAYKEMIAQHCVEAETPEEAAILFSELDDAGAIAWSRGDDDVEIADIAVDGVSVDFDQ